MKSKSRRTGRLGRVVDVRPAGDEHQVVTVESETTPYRRRPCSDCPWRTDTVRMFPAEAFVHSASTVYDMARNTFACHQVGPAKPAVCAGFLLRGADHNLTVRLARLRGVIQDDVADGGAELHADYRTMAVANGVDPDHPELVPCR